MSGILDKLVKGLFSYPVIAAGSGAALGLGIWHATHSSDYHISGYSTTYAGLQSDEYRESLALMSVFTQFAALAFGLLYPRIHSGLSNLTLRLNYVLLLALIGVWLGYIFDDGEDEGLRTAVISISAAFSGVVFLVSFGETIYGKFMETPLDAAQMPTSANMGMRYFQRLPFSPLFTRGASLIYLIATTVYLAYGNAINDTSVVNRDPTSALTEVERVLLHEEDQWKNVMFIASIFALFTLGLLFSKAENLPAEGRPDKRHHRGVLAIVLTWLIVVGLECGTAFTHQGHDDYANLRHYTGVAHLVFAAFITVAINDNALRTGQVYSDASLIKQQQTSGHAGYSLMGGYY